MEKRRQLIDHCSEEVSWHNLRYDLRFPLPTAADESIKWPRWIEEQRRLVDRSLHRVEHHSECREDSVHEHWRSCSSMCVSISVRCSSLSASLFLNDKQVVRSHLRCFFSRHMNWSIESFNWAGRVGSIASDDSFGSSFDTAKKNGLTRGRRAQRGEERRHGWRRSERKTMKFVLLVQWGD